MLGWFQALMPKEERFFDLFVRHAETVVAGAQALRQLLRGDNEIPHCYRLIVEREAQADEITRAVLMAVRRSFITPFDRSDIQGLISSMDDAIDQSIRPPRSSTCSRCRASSSACAKWGTSFWRPPN